MTDKNPEVPNPIVQKLEIGSNDMFTHYSGYEILGLVSDDMMKHAVGDFNLKMPKTKS